VIRLLRSPCDHFPFEKVAWLITFVARVPYSVLLGLISCFKRISDCGDQGSRAKAKTSVASSATTAMHLSDCGDESSGTKAKTSVASSATTATHPTANAACSTALRQAEGYTPTCTAASENYSTTFYRI